MDKGYLINQDRSKAIYRFNDEPKGNKYLMLLNHAVQSEFQILLIWRDQLKLSKHGIEFRQKMVPHLLWEKRTNRWPGSYLSKLKASVSAFQCQPELMPYLSEPGHLLGWQAPDFPEDIAFVRGDGLVLASVSHEKDAWVLSKEWVRRFSGFSFNKETISYSEWELFYSPEAALCKPIRPPKKRKKSE